MIRKTICRQGVRYWNHRIPDRFQFLCASQAWGRDDLQKRQMTLLRDLLIHAHRVSPYYRQIMNEHGVDPSQRDSLDQLSRMPFLTKDVLTARFPDMQIRVQGERQIYSETSGSTGKPLVFYRNEDWDAWHRATALRGQSWYGVQPWERSGYLWGYNLSPRKRYKTQFLDALQNRFRLFSYNPVEMGRFLDKLTSARSLSGYSSMIYELAKRKLQARSGNRYDLRMIKGTSEKIFSHYQDTVKMAFGRKIVSEYGSAECGIMAFESPCGNMHITMETVIIEEIDGEIVVTNLVSRSLPIIRYRLGDYIKISDHGLCTCGMDRPVIEEILGRVGKIIYGKRTNYPSLTLYYIFKNLALSGTAILNYQAIQRHKGQLVLRIEETLGDHQRQALREEINKYYKDDMDVSVTENETILSGTKKRIDFISEIND